MRGLGVNLPLAYSAHDLPGHGKPGLIFIGVNDDGTCKGLQVTDKLLRNLADMRDDGNIQPMPSMTLEKKVLCGCELAVVIVRPSILSENTCHLQLPQKFLNKTSVLLRTNSLHYDSWTIMRNLQCSSEVIGQEKKLDKQGKYLIVSV